MLVEPTESFFKCKGMASSLFRLKLQ